jgi:hypothetical protein
VGVPLTGRSGASSRIPGVHVPIVLVSKVGRPLRGQLVLATSRGPGVLRASYGLETGV